MKTRISTTTAIGVMLASLALVGCSKSERQDAADTGSNAVATVQEKAKDVANDAANGMDKAKDAAANASAKLGDKIDDAVITTSVKTELAKDASLSALKISVATDNGRVALTGTAPSNQARDQATTLAQGVKGVVSVDNQLTVAPKG